MEVHKMEGLDSNSVEIMMKSDDNEGIIIQDTVELINKDEESETTEYFLHVESQEENQDAEFESVDGDCEENEEAQFVAVDVDDADQIILHDKDVILWNELCRICANGSDRFIPIFSGEGLEHSLRNKIHTYLPLRVSENDSLPHQVCYNCAATLLAWHEMFKGCLNAQQRLLELQAKFKEQFYNDAVVEEENIEQTVLEVETANGEDQQESAKQDNTEETAEVVNIVESERAVPSPKKQVAEGSSSGQHFRYMCGLCNELYDEESELVRHLRTVHSDTPDVHSHHSLRYECNVCNRSYKQKANLIRHMFSHSVDIGGEDGVVERSKFFKHGMLMFKCETCGREMTPRRAFLRHLRLHKNERPIICHICGKDYRLMEDLKRHVSDVHDKIKRFACDICSQFFAARATRDAHRRIHTGEKPFLCDVCPKNFRSASLLGIHKRTHNNIRPFHCTHCNKSFKDKQKLGLHETLHTGIKAYLCDVCGKTFAVKSEATRHRAIHNDDKPFHCPACGLGFKINKYLRMHVKSRHKDQAETLLKDLYVNQ